MTQLELPFEPRLVSKKRIAKRTLARAQTLCATFPPGKPFRIEDVQRQIGLSVGAATRFVLWLMEKEHRVEIVAMRNDTLFFRIPKKPPTMVTLH